MNKRGAVKPMSIPFVLGMVIALLALPSFEGFADATGHQNCDRPGAIAIDTALLNPDVTAVRPDVTIDLSRPISAGIYSVTLVSFDNHTKKLGDTDQTEEQWFAQLIDADGQVVYSSDPIRDLPDNQEFITDTFDRQTVTGTATQLRAVHRGGGDSVNSVVALCAFVRTVTPDGTTTTIPNGGPLALPNGPYSGIVNEAVAFHSVVWPDDIESYLWEFGDGDTSDRPNPEHSYDKAGEYAVTLTITDDDGDSDDATTTASISDCRGDPSKVERFRVSPESGKPGSSVDLEIAFAKEWLRACGPVPVEFTLNGHGVIGTLLVGASGPFSITGTIPDDAEPGQRELGAQTSGESPTVLSVLPFEVEASGRWVLLLVVALVAGALIISGRYLLFPGPSTAEIRVLNGEVTLGGEPYRRALAVGVEHRLKVWIGEPTDRSITQRGAPPVPTEELPPGDKWIDVNFVCEQNAVLTQQNRLLLADQGSTEPVEFELRADMAGPLFGRLVLLFEGRVLQTAVLRADVVADQPSRRGAPEIEVEAIVRGSFTSVEGQEPYDLAVIVNSDDTDTRSATVVKEDGGVTWRKVDGLDHLIEQLTNLLTSIADDPDRYNTLTSEASRELLFELAHAGSSLHSAFVRDHEVDPKFFENGRVQVISAAQESYLPVELFYSRLAPTVDKLCDDWEKSVLSGSCAACDTLTTDDEIPICLTGFWGVQFIVERHAYDKAFAELPGDYRLQNEPTAASNQLNPLTKLVWAMSDKVNPDDQESLRETLGSGYTAEEATSWKDLKAKVGGGGLTMLFLVPHADQAGITPALEIGGDELLRSTLIESRLSGLEKGAQVFVVLLGCETAVPSIPFQGFVPPFRRAGGVVVVSTMATILGRHAVPVAIELLRLMKSGVNAPTEGLGDVLRQLRRQALHDGYPMVLSIVAYGDADWRITS